MFIEEILGLRSVVNPHAVTDILKKDFLANGSLDVRVQDVLLKDFYLAHVGLPQVFSDLSILGVLTLPFISCKWASFRQLHCEVVLLEILKMVQKFLVRIV